MLSALTIKRVLDPASRKAAADNPCTVVESTQFAEGTVKTVSGKMAGGTVYETYIVYPGDPPIMTPCIPADRKGWALENHRDLVAAVSGEGV